MTDTQMLIKPMEARHVLWHFRQPGGIEPGSFVTKLLEAMAAADPMNLRRLGVGFPGYGLAMTWALNDLQGFARLQRVAGVTLCGTCEGAGSVALDPPVLQDGHLRSLGQCPDCRGRGVT